jgi:hypothetical protein
MTHDEMLKASLELETGTHGSFAALIGEAYLKADSSNAERLAKAFPELFQKGLSFAKSKGVTA